MTGAASRPATHAERDGKGFLVAAAALVAVAVTASLTTGSWWIPHNDDWAFTRIAERFARTGDTSLIGWNNTSVVGQVFALGPLGTSALARHLFVLAGAALFVGCCHWAVRERHGSWWAGFAVLTVVLSGPFLLLATSFMTDLPAAGLMLLSFVVGRQSVRRGSVALLAASLVAGLWAATVRDTAIVAPIAVLAGHTWTRLRAGRVPPAGLSGPVLATAWTALAGTFLLFELWRRSLPWGMNPEVKADLAAGGLQVVALFFTVSMLVLPAVLVQLPRCRNLRSFAAGCITFGTGSVMGDRGAGLLTGNYISEHGAYYAAGLGWRTPWFGVSPAILQLTALVAGSLLAATLAAPGTLRALDTTWALYSLGIVASLVTPAILGQGLFDRYMLPLVVPVLLLVLPRQDQAREVAPTPGGARRVLTRGAGMAAVLASAALTLSLTLEALAYDAARWGAAEALTRSGTPPTDIAAGLEWLGYHAGTPANADRKGRDRWFWATSMFDGARSCYLVAASPVAGADLLTTTTYRTYVLFGESPLYTYATGECRGGAAS